jgi:hypothetical protein
VLVENFEQERVVVQMVFHLDLLEFLREEQVLVMTPRMAEVRDVE